jgi:hypothetical protein
VGGHERQSADPRPRRQLGVSFCATCGADHSYDMGLHKCLPYIMSMLAQSEGSTEYLADEEDWVRGARMWLIVSGSALCLADSSCTKSRQSGSALLRDRPAYHADERTRHQPRRTRVV